MSRPPDRYPPDDPREWLRRACSSLIRAKSRKEGVCLEDLCFDAQQTAEKALKAVFVAHNIKFPYTHDIGRLLEKLQEAGFDIKRMKKAVRLSDYAVAARYPGLQEPVSVKEYRTAIKTAEKVFNWTKNQLNI